MRCDQCRFWHETEGDKEDRGMRACHGVREAHEITRELPEDARDDALLAARAYVLDADDYSAALVTAPDYFCALFSAK